MPPPSVPVTVELIKLPSLPELGDCWQDLEGRAKPSFFLTWSWIGNWLASLGDHARHGKLLRASRGERVVGLAVVFEAPIRRRMLPIGRALFVNETGLDEFDALYIEYNGLLTEKSNEAEVQQAMLGRACDADSGGRELQLRRVVALPSSPISVRPGMVPVRGDQQECSVVDLDKVRSRGGDYLGLLSAGRRAHIRRCMRAYGNVGPLQLTIADDLPTALAFFDRLVDLHNRRWALRGRRSSFTSPFCLDFHKRTIADALHRGRVQLLRVSAGERELGYLYSFVHDGRVYFYQSGYDYNVLDSRFSPGLVTLVLAIQHNAGLGMRTFDFLAGDQTYKTSLGTDHAVMASWTFHRRSWLSMTEDLLRSSIGPARRLRNAMRSLWAVSGPVRALAAVLVIGVLAAVLTELLDPDRELLRTLMSLIR
jgi:hypothetical protein